MRRERKDARRIGTNGASVVADERHIAACGHAASMTPNPTTGVRSHTLHEPAWLYARRLLGVQAAGPRSLYSTCGACQMLPGERVYLQMLDHFASAELGQ